MSYYIEWDGWIENYKDVWEWWHGGMTWVGKVLFIPLVLMVLTIVNLLRWVIFACLFLIAAALVIAVRVLVRYDLKEVLGGLLFWGIEESCKEIDV